MGEVIQLFPKNKQDLFEEMDPESRATEQAFNAYGCMLLSLDDDLIATADDTLQGDLQVLNNLILGLTHRANGLTSEYTNLLDRLQQGKAQ